MPKVSVVMPSYNHAPYVREAVESVLKQSYSDLELIITDDGSIDGTADIVRSFTDPRIRFHAFERNQGACIAMNDAINRSSGEYVAVLNSDDYFLPGKIERQVIFLDSNSGIGAVFGRPFFVNEVGAPLAKSKNPFAEVFTDRERTRIEWLRHLFTKGNCLCHPTVMMRRFCYDKVGVYNPLLMQLPDFDMWVRLCQKFEIHVMPEPMTAFRILDRERNTSSPSPKGDARCAWELIEVLGHYAAMPDHELRTIVEPWPENIAGRAPKVTLALAAIHSGRPGFCQFGLALLRDCICQDAKAFPVIEYFRLVGEIDPCGDQFAGRMFRHLINSRIFRLIRKLIGSRRH